MDLTAKTEALAQLIEERLGVRGDGFEAKIRKAGRRLPRFVRAEARVILAALPLEGHPKLARQIDAARLDQAVHRIDYYLRKLDPYEARKTQVIQWLAGVSFSLLLIAGLTFATIVARGLF